MIRSFLLLLAFTGLPILQTSQFDTIIQTPIISVAPVPIQINDFSLPDIHAKSALVMDQLSGTVLYKKNIHTRLPMASLTKIMTAIIILEENDIQDTVTINFHSRDIEGAKMHLLKYETISVQNLLYGLLIASANDAANALAQYNAQTHDAFVEKMNRKAHDLGLYDTHFTNPVGFDDEQNLHYSTAHDLAFLTLYALKKPFFRDTVKITHRTVSSQNGKISHTLKNTNKLLQSYLPFEGVKTGTTDAAGQCLITLHPISKHTRILTVMLNSEDRFQETKLLIENILKNYNW